jgi:hypothetical protein
MGKDKRTFAGKGKAKAAGPQGPQPWVAGSESDRRTEYKAALNSQGKRRAFAPGYLHSFGELPPGVEVVSLETKSKVWTVRTGAGTDKDPTRDIPLSLMRLNVEQQEPAQLLKLVTTLGEAAQLQPYNARNGCGDVGGMLGLGQHVMVDQWCATTGKKRVDVFVAHKDEALHQAAIPAMVSFGELLQRAFPETAQGIQASRGGRAVPDCLGGLRGLSPTADISTNLGNSSHVDLDCSPCAAVWAERYPGTARGWYLVYPNVGKRGLAIQLSHGTVIAWDGRYLRHCSAVPACGERDGSPNMVWGFFLGNSAANAGAWEQWVQEEGLAAFHSKRAGGCQH